MKIKFDVTHKELNIIQDIFAKHLCDDCNVWVFGSRAKNTALFNSDLDLAIECKDKIDLNKLNKIKSDLEFSRLPYTVDLIDINAIKLHFKDLIQNEMIEFPIINNSNVPKLRFKDFSGEYGIKKLSDFSSKCNEKNKDESITEVFTNSAVNGIVSQRDFFDKDIAIQGNLEGYYIVTKNNFIYNPRISTHAPVGPLNRNNLSTGVMSPLYTVFSINDEAVSLEYLEKYFKTTKWYKYMCGVANYGARSDRMNITSSDFFSMPLNLPVLTEQTKIASFLTTVDNKIELLTQKEKLHKDYKKGIMHKIFSQEIRFKADDGSEFPEWVEKRFGEVFKRITTKNKEDNQNILTISAQQGLINQEKYFNKSVSAKDVTGYYLLESGDFAYNKSYSKGYPMGAIKKLNNYDKGVVSTLYICFRINNENASIFYEKYFESGFFNKELHKIAQEGARNHGLLNMSVVEFFNDMKIPLPSIEEQTKIANFLSTIDSKIEQVTTQLEATKLFKKALLQQMFV